MSRRPTRTPGRKQPRGFTLIELSVALLLVGLLIGIGLPAVGAVTAAGLRQSAGQIAGISREAYARAAISGKPHRLVMDLDEQTFWLEVASDHFVLEAEKTKQLTEAEIKAQKEGGGAGQGLGGGRSRILATSERDLDEGERLRLEVTRGPTWSPVEDELGQPHRLPSECAFEKVWVAHQAEAFVRGQSHLYFWPAGHAESAVIRLTDDEENASRVISVKVNGLTGRSAVLDKAVEIPST
ncbi:MAG: prepilin-type N-terminal cleavage/methylation domain-containing protein [Myxococcota bacterium]